MNELALFAGAGGGILGGKLLGWDTIGAVEIEDYPRRVLLQRQKDAILSPFPIWDDITTFDGKPWKGCVDIVSGGFPCQDISAAGKGVGISGERSGLWKEMSRVVDEVRPRFVYVENSPMLASRGLGTVLGDMAKMGYDARWCVLGADDFGAPHRRKRIWILAYSNLCGCSPRGDSERKYKNSPVEVGKAAEGFKQRSFGKYGSCEDSTDVAYPDQKGLQGQLQFRQGERITGRFSPSCAGISGAQRIDWWREDPGESTAQSGLGRVAYGMANRVDRLKAIGNGQVPAVAATAFVILSEGLI